MKFSVLAFFMLFAIGVNAQITLEHSYPNQVYYDPMGMVHLSSAGYKYAIADSDQIVLYNLNHSLYATIAIPNQPAGNFNYRVWWISDALFNTNPNDIEYAITYTTLSTNVSHLRVYDEAGNLLFARDTFTIDNTLYPANGLKTYGIFHNSAGTKMILRNQFTQVISVYSLPGVLPCEMCDGGVISGIQPQTGATDHQQQLGSPYPNPTNSTTTIPYTLPAESSSGTLIIYDVAGREVKRYAVTNAFASLELSTADLAEGTYSYSLEAGGVILPGKKFVVVK